MHLGWHRLHSSSAAAAQQFEEVSVPSWERISRRYIAVVSKISLVTGSAIAWLVIPATAVMLREVIGRYFFNSPSVWAPELSMQLIAFFFLVGGAYTMLSGGHVGVDIISSRLTGKAAVFAAVVRLLLATTFLGVLIYSGSLFAFRSISILEHSGTDWNVIIYPLKTVIPVASSLLLLQTIAQFLIELLQLLGRRV